MTAHGTISEQVYLHAAILDTAIRPFGPTLLLSPAHADIPLTFDGVASDGRPCRAVTQADVRCPKDSAVALFVDGALVAVCGGHMGVHRRGKVLWLVVEP